MQIAALEVFGITSEGVSAWKVDDTAADVRGLDGRDSVGELSGGLEGVGDIDHERGEKRGYAALRDAYTHLVGKGVAILRATNHINQRSFYFADPDGNTLEIYYELPDALEIFARGRDDRDVPLVFDR